MTIKVGERLPNVSRSTRDGHLDRLELGDSRRSRRLSAGGGTSACEDYALDDGNAPKAGRQSRGQFLDSGQAKRNRTAALQLLKRIPDLGIIGPYRSYGWKKTRGAFMSAIHGVEGPSRLRRTSPKYP